MSQLEYDAVRRLTEQLAGLVRDRKRLTGAEAHLANLGATHDLLAYVDQQNAKACLCE